MNMIQSILANFPLWTAIYAIIFAQVAKVLWYAYFTGDWNFHWLFSSGGMPSSHTAAVTALATSIGLTDGWDSSSFALATIFGVIVMYDATGVRRQAGVHAQILNQLLEDFSLLVNEIKHMKTMSPMETKIKLKEILGHKPIEVFVGAWFGILFALFMYQLWY